LFEYLPYLAMTVTLLEFHFMALNNCTRHQLYATQLTVQWTQYSDSPELAGDP
jgi:hypothetical protein